MKKYDYLIVGAGLFGATFANLATQNGKKCLVVEKRPNIGGNVFTEEEEGITVHKYGAHIFHTSNEEVWEYINRFATFKNFINSPVAVFRSEVYNLPFNMNTFSKMFSVIYPAEVKKIIDDEKTEISKTPENLEEKAISLVGRTIYTKLIKGYTEKQWGKDCKALPPSIIERLPVRLTYDNNYFNDKYQAIPEGGYTKVIEKMLEGCDILLSTDFLEDKEKLLSLAEKCVYTGPIDAYFNYSLGALEYRSLRFETEKLPTENYQGVAVMNFCDREVPYTRIIEHKHFENKGQKNTIITREYPENWDKEKEPYYPINDDKNNCLYEKYQALAEKEENIIFGGRLAQYKYYDMDKCIASAIEFSKKEL